MNDDYKQASAKKEPHDIDNLLLEEKQSSENNAMDGTEPERLQSLLPRSDSDFLRSQSIMNPDKKAMLEHYGLDDFRNSIWENFLGSQVQLSYT
jgi:hypothetical protein